MKTLWLVPFLLLATVSVQAADTKPAAKPESGGDNSKLVCFIEPKTGSHIKKRVCMTEAERETRMKQDQDAMTKLRGSSTAASKSVNK